MEPSLPTAAGPEAVGVADPERLGRLPALIDNVRYSLDVVGAASCGEVVGIRLLGPVQVVGRSGLVDAGPVQRRAVLASLAVDVGRSITMAALVDRLWDEVPPSRAREALYSHISRLRRLIVPAETCDRRGMDGHDGLAVEPPVIRLIGRGTGYRLDIDPELIDLHRFRRLAAAARDAGGDDVQLASLLDRALQQWSGVPLADLPGQWAARMRIGWQQERLDVAVQWAFAQLRLSRHGEVIGHVRSLLEDYPLAEPLVEVLMRALVAAGRDAEALDCYAVMRTRLSAELGVEPGPQLRSVHRALLQGRLDRPPVSSPVIAVPASREQTDRAEGRLRLAQLPRNATWFTGRTAELTQLLTMASDQERDSAVLIGAIDGMAGIGKTALAVYAAHRLAGCYPDGQLFVDLHGFTETVRPVEPADALDRLLRTLGVPGERIPAGLEDRAALWRSVLAGRRMLIVLDDAATAAQVAPLLPGAAGCLVLVTSRRRLAGLEATHTVSLDTLPVNDAVVLLAGTASQPRLAAEPHDLLVEAVDLCGRLPLAIRIAAARLRSRPAWGLADLVARLRDQTHRLAELADHCAGTRSLATALELSYQQLPADQQRLYRLLGIHPGPDLDCYAAAAMADVPLAEVRRLLDQLVDAHLLQEPTAGRFVLHDLVRVHSASTATDAPTAPSQRAALTRLLDYYRHTAAVAMDAAFPNEGERRPAVPPARSPTPDLPDPARAIRWLDRELPDVLAAVMHAAEAGWHEHVWHVSAILHKYLCTSGRYRSAETLHRQALTIGRTTGHRISQLHALLGLGDTHRLQGQCEESADHFRQALELARVAGDRTSEQSALHGLGIVHMLRSRFEEATDHLGEALELARTTGSHVGEARALYGIGAVHMRQGRYDQADDCLTRSLKIARTVGDRVGELNALHGLGEVGRIQGRYELAADHLGTALQIACATGNRTGEMSVLRGLGHVHTRLERYGDAADVFDRALEIGRAIGNRAGELSSLVGLANVNRMRGRYEQATEQYRQLRCLAQRPEERNWQYEASQGLGRLYHTTGRPDDALAEHQRALALAHDLQQLPDQARAHDGLARAYHILNQPEPARHHWQHALDILVGLGISHTDDEAGVTTATLRAHLNELPP